jgi:type II secretory ATPase GspE/PulE/Tfp pilus assembly ATPase PilB-like protein
MHSCCASRIVPTGAPRPRWSRKSSPEELVQAIRRQHGLSSIRLGARLLQLGLIAADELDRALAVQRVKGQHLGEILLALGLVSAEHIQQLLCEQLGIPLVELAGFRIDERVLRLVPEELARECRVLPIGLFDGKLFVAVSDPFDTARLERIRFVVEMPVVPVVASWQDLDDAIHAHYGSAISYAQPNIRYTEVQRSSEFDRDGLRVNPLDASVVNLVNRIIADAYAAGASDIHLDASATSDQVAVRFRHEGQLTDYLEIPRHLRRAVVARIKALSGIDVSAHAYEGRISRVQGGPADLQLRVIALPTRDGREHIAIKLVHAREPLSLDALGLSESVADTIRPLVAKPSSLLLIAGPPRCGKTTTVHAMLNLVDVTGTKIWTAESPVETMRAGTSQVEVNEAMAGIIRRSCAQSCARIPM